MATQRRNIMPKKYIEIPDGFIVFISGVPGVGKTTISYELLKRYDKFRIIEETDIMREILRGYNTFLTEKFGEEVNFIFNQITIPDHNKILNLEEAKEQCCYMKNSLEQIVARQQRKGIATIINGVHIVPEIMNGLAQNFNIIYINLYIDNEQVLYQRLVNRDPKSYLVNYTPLLYKINKDLFDSTATLSRQNNFLFNNINITKLSIVEVIDIIQDCIKELLIHAN